MYRRFFTVHPALSEAEVERFTHVDYVDRLALVVEDGTGLVAVGRYDRLPGTDEAEVAFVVTDRLQHQGIATFLLERLAGAAWRNGIATFTAQTLASNGDMLSVFEDSGFPVTAEFDDGLVNVRFPICPDEKYRAAYAARHGVSTPEGPSDRDG